MSAEESTAACVKGYENGWKAVCGKISETLKAKHRPGGALHVADPFNAYLDRHAVSKPIMRYNNVRGQGMYLNYLSGDICQIAH